MVSAHTGHVGKSQPRGSGLDAAVDRISAIAGIVASDLNLSTRRKYTPSSLMMSQHKCVDFAIFRYLATFLFCNAASSSSRQFRLAHRCGRLLSKRAANSPAHDLLQEC